MSEKLHRTPVGWRWSRDPRVEIHRVDPRGYSLRLPQAYGWHACRQRYRFRSLREVRKFLDRLELPDDLEAWVYTSNGRILLKDLCGVCGDAARAHPDYLCDCCR